MSDSLQFIEDHQVLVGVLLALTGYLAKYRYDLSLSRREADLERVNLQLRKLYGPLHAITEGSTAAWQAFRTKYRPGKSYFSTSDPPTTEDEAAWRSWMEHVFTPLNRQMMELVTNNADLYVGPQTPPEFLELVAHVVAYEVVLDEWASGDFTNQTSVINFPSGFNDVVASHYLQLIERQKALIR